jgi:hypothetical protein
MIDAIEIYANTIQCHINLQQYDLALEYTERYRCKQLVDLIASKDLYQDEKIPEKVRNLMQEHEKLQRQIENIRDRDTREDSNNNRSSILPTHNQILASRKRSSQQKHHRKGNRKKKNLGTNQKTRPSHRPRHPSSPPKI